MVSDNLSIFPSIRISKYIDNIIGKPKLLIPLKISSICTFSLHPMLFYLYPVPFLSHRHSYARYPKASEMAGVLRNILPFFPTQVFPYAKYLRASKVGEGLHSIYWRDFD
jgi:hypothetical protein